MMPELISNESLDSLGIFHGTDQSSRYHGYLNIFEPLFAPMREKPIAVLEIGTQFGFSAKTWLDYFPNAQVFGLDIVKGFETDNPRFHFIEGDIRHPTNWMHLLPRLNIVIDDGPHLLESSISCFHALWPKLEPGGLYIIEDVQTWFDTNYQSMMGGRNLEGPMLGMAMARFFGDMLNELNQYGQIYYGRPGPAVESPRQSSIAFLHFHRGLIIIGKK